MALIQATLPTTVTTVNDLFYTQYISRVVRDVAREPLVGQNFVNVVDLTDESAVNSYTYSVDIWADITAATAVVDNDAAAESALSTDQVSIVGSRYARRTFVLYNTSRGIASSVTKAAELMTRACRMRNHTASLALATSLTNTQGGASTVHDLANHDLVMHNFKVQDHDDGPIVMGLHDDAVRDLRADLISNAAALYGATWGDRAANALQTTSGGGIAWDGITVYQSSDMPVGDTTGWTNMVVVTGDLAAIEMPVWQDLQPFMQHDESRFGVWIGCSIICEQGIVKNANARKFITRT